MKGKSKCRILKEIRQRIADENDIPYVTRECTYQGDCRGTCPKCEAELRYLERELEKRRRLGKSVAVAAVAAGLSLSLTACVPGGSGSGGETVAPSGQTQPDTRDTRDLPGRITDPSETEGPLEGEPTELEGDVAAPTETEEEILLGDVEVIEGELALPPDTTVEVPELLGDVAYLTETGGEETGTDEAPPETAAARSRNG